MAIFNRVGDAVAVLRFATLNDVRTVDNRKPDKQDEAAIDNRSYVIVREPGGSNGFRERLYHQAYLRADGGCREISEALEAREREAQFEAELNARAESEIQAANETQYGVDMGTEHP